MSEKKKKPQGQKKEKPAAEKEIRQEQLKEATESKDSELSAKLKEPKKEEEIVISKKRQNIQFIIFTGVILIIFLAIVFVPRFIQKATLEKNKYNGFDFVKTSDGHWYTVVQKGNQPYQISFYYHPKDLEDIPVEANLKDKFFNIRNNNGSIYITIDPDSKNNTIVIAGVEIAKITGKGYNLLNVNTHSAFIKQPNSTAVDTVTPVVTCGQANDKIMVIWITLSNKNIAYSYGNCVILEATSYGNMVRVADRMMYNLLGIMLN
jgi:hypothetical protein